LFGRTLTVLAAGELRSATLGLANGRHVWWCSASPPRSRIRGPVCRYGGLVGLVAPRLVTGIAHQRSPHRGSGAALCCGTLLCLADLLSRTVVAPRQLPVGAVMALIGAPVFLAVAATVRHEELMPSSGAALGDVAPP
jgi:iron complex transport system permease protein